MKERLLQYIWQFQYFNKNDLTTSNGEQVQIIHPGTFNRNQGPDFSEARIRIDDTTWAGNVELHINASDWDLHNHSTDAAYGNIILHVVWKNDREIKDISGKRLPTIELHNRISKILLNKYEEFMIVASFIPCERQISTIDELTLTAWKERLMIERLEIKSKLILSFLQENGFHWEETFWWLLAKNFGAKINGESFEKVARSLPVSLLARHKNQVQQLEAFLFGQAGLLDTDFHESYPSMLKKEYQFLKRKYELQKPEAHLFFLRMRPANFPTIRLAQLAILISQSSHLFSRIKESENVLEVINLLDVTANDYWHYHYKFDEESAFKKKNLGSQMVDNLLINTIIPMLFVFGLYYKEQKFKDKALAWLQDISAEKNVITNAFESLKLSNKNSFDSQALLQLKHEYCDKRRCLECAVGNSLIR